MKGSEKYKDLLELMPAIQEASIKGLKRDFQDYDYDILRIRKKIRMFYNMITIFQGKWTMEICYILLVHGECSFNELKHELPGISSRTFTDRLRLLEKKLIIKRRVLTTKQIRVYYKLTQFGKRLIVFFTPTLLSFGIPFILRKDLPKIKPLKSTINQEPYKERNIELELIEK